MKAPLLALSLLLAAAGAPAARASEWAPPGVVLHGPERASAKERAWIQGELRRFDLETRQHEITRMLDRRLGRPRDFGMTVPDLVRERELLDQRFYLEAASIFKGAVVGVGLVIVVLSLFQNILFGGRHFSAWQFAIFAALVAWLLIGWRFAFRMGLRHLRRRGWNLRHVPIIGTGRLGRLVHHTLKRNSWTGFNPACFISHHEKTGITECLDTPVIGGLSQLEELLDGSELTGVFIALPGLIVSTIWFASVNYFRKLAQAKFKVIADLERHFSVRPFDLEWKYFESRDASESDPKGRRYRVRLRLTFIEMLVPAALSVISGVYLIYWVFVRLIL